MNKDVAHGGVWDASFRAITAFLVQFCVKIFTKARCGNNVEEAFYGAGYIWTIYNHCFFSYNAALQGENAGEIVARLKRDLLPTLVRGILFWPICDFFTFKFILVHLQPLVNSSCAYVWTIYLTYMASLEKVGTS